MSPCRWLGEETLEKAVSRDLLYVEIPEIDEEKVHGLAFEGGEAVAVYKFRGDEARESAEAFAEKLRKKGYEANVEDTLESDKAFVDVKVKRETPVSVCVSGIILDLWE